MAVDHALLEVEEAQPLASVRNPTAPEAAVLQEVHQLISCEVPRVSWGAFCEAFNGRYHLSLVTVEHRGRDQRSRLKPPPQRLIEMSLEFSERGCDAVHIFLRSTPRSFRHTTTVSRRAHIRLVKHESGADEGLEIESTDGSRTLLRFCSPMLLEIPTFGEPELARVVNGVDSPSATEALENTWAVRAKLTEFPGPL